MFIQNPCIMKTKLFFLILVIPFYSGFSQQSYTLNDIKNTDRLIWFGLDFSLARMYGTFNDKPKIQSVFLDAWNNTMVDGRIKGGGDFDLKKVLRKKRIDIDLSVVNTHNFKTTVGELFGFNDINSSIQIDKKVIDSVLAQYNAKVRNGIGMVLIVESFDKTQELATVWVTFFDPDTNQVIYTRKYSGIADGMGMTKHWVIGILDILKEVRRNNF